MRGLCVCVCVKRGFSGWRGEIYGVMCVFYAERRVSFRVWQCEAHSSSHDDVVVHWTHGHTHSTGTYPPDYHVR